jgi:hypothetical protein
MPVCGSSKHVDGFSRWKDPGADDHPAQPGQIAAERVQSIFGRRHPGDVFRDLVGGDDYLTAVGSPAVQGLAQRANGGMRAVVQAQNHAQARFRLCHAVFVGRQAGSGEDRLITPAKTRRHQAGRAFAAEVLAPTALLTERTGGRRPTMPRVEL